jgi:pSer/pThr/pTyr-binding forkhead associated (FHA) protein
MMDKCPFCGADTRPGDNFCLNCGNRLLATTPSPSSPMQAQPSMGDATIAATEGWGNSSGLDANSASGPTWGFEENAQTMVGPSDQQTFRPDPLVTIAPEPDKIEQPARFSLRSENGEVLQEYPLDKYEISIGRAPNSDILLSKDKLTSRRHATVRYESGQYLLRDERSANGTFVNGQQIEDLAPHVLKDNDHVGIGEHELLFQAYGAKPAPREDVSELATVNIARPPEVDYTWRTTPDESSTVAPTSDFGTNAIEPEEAAEVALSKPVAESEPERVENSTPPVAPVAAPSVPVAPTFSVPSSNSNSPRASEVRDPEVKAPEKVSQRAFETPDSSSYGNNESNITFGRLTSLPQPSLPDIGALVAALSALDGQVTTLQDQLNASQEAVRNHEAEIAQTANQLRSGVRRVSERMDSTIADVARSRETLAWSELLQLMEDVMSNPRDIEYVTKLARKARELNKVFQLHQNVLSTMAECNSLLRSMIGE